MITAQRQLWATLQPSAPSPGVEVRTVFFDPVNSLVSGSMTEQQWIDGIKSASDQMRANIIE